MSPITDSAKPRLASKARLKWDDVRHQHLLLFPEGVLVLNPTASEVVALCDGHRTVADIIKVLGEQYRTAAAGQDTRELLGRLADKGLLVILE